MDLAALDRSKKKSHRLIMGERRHHVFSDVLIGPFSFLQVIRRYIKVWMSSNFGQIPLLTTELADLE